MLREVRQLRTNTVGVHLYEIPKTARLLETGSRKMRDGRGARRLLVKGCRVWWLE